MEFSQTERPAVWEILDSHRDIVGELKIKPNEKPITAAKREAPEETGCTVHVYELLEVFSYLNSGGPKIAHFWRMRTTRKAAKSLTDDIKAVGWLPLSRAIERLSLPHEQHFLRNVGRHALRKSPVM